MTNPPTTRSVSLFVAGVVSLLASACATGDLLTNNVEIAGARYSAQECVENALRNRPDPDVVRDAALAFATACRGGEVASCSVLGVMNELGRGVPLSAPQALVLYEGACNAHNLRACGNLGELLLGDKAGARDPARAVSLLRTACDGGQGRACERLGRAYRDGDGEPRDPVQAASFFDTGCATGSVQACADLADQVALSRQAGLPKGA